MTPIFSIVFPPTHSVQCELAFDMSVVLHRDLSNEQIHPTCLLERGKRNEDVSSELDRSKEARS